MNDILEKNDSVNHPQHYMAPNGLETIDVIEAFTSDLMGVEAVCTANALKYICRWKKKNGIEDLRKAKWYLDRLISKYEEGEHLPFFERLPAEKRKAKWYLDMLISKHEEGECSSFFERMSAEKRTNPIIVEPEHICNFINEAIKAGYVFCGQHSADILTAEHVLNDLESFWDVNGYLCIVFIQAGHNLTWIPYKDYDGSISLLHYPFYIDVTLSATLSARDSSKK